MEDSNSQFPQACTLMFCFESCYTPYTLRLSPVVLLQPYFPPSLSLSTPCILVSDWYKCSLVKTPCYYRWTGSVNKEVGEDLNKGVWYNHYPIQSYFIKDPCCVNKETTLRDTRLYMVNPVKIFRQQTKFIKKGLNVCFTFFWRVNKRPLFLYIMFSFNLPFWGLIVLRSLLC